MNSNLKDSVRVCVFDSVWVGVFCSVADISCRSVSESVADSVSASVAYSVYDRVDDSIDAKLFEYEF